MTYRYDFIGVGGLAYDLVLRVNHLLISDEKYPARLVGKLPGGFIANATCAAATLGLRSGYIGWVGDDADGDMLRDDFLARSVDPVGLVHVAGHVTPFTVVLTDSAGRRGILLPASPLYEQALNAAQLDLASETRVLFTFPRDLDWFSRLRRRTLEGGGLIALDVENTVPLQGAELRQVLRLTDVVFLKHSALSAIGVYALEELVQPDQWIVMTSGSRGATGIAGDMAEPVTVPAYPVEAVDTTGAGDCFHAALLAARLDGATLVEAMRFANAAAALKVGHYGARGGLPTREQIASFVQQRERQDP